jgi:hypothetical protein
MSVKDLQAQRDALRAKRKPAPTEAELVAKAEEAALHVEIAAELRALRVEENDVIIAKHASTKTRRFFDFDPDGEQPATVEHNGKACALYTRFVVRGANADQLERNADAIVVRGVDAKGVPDVTFDASKTAAVLVECAETCIVYPTAESAGASVEQHAKNIKASLWHLGAARAVVGNAAIELGGVDAAARRTKS